MKMVLYYTWFALLLNVNLLNQISKFLSKNKNFYLEKFITKKNDNDYNSMIKNGMMFTLPSKYMGFNIDGYFAAHLKMKV